MNQAGPSERHALAPTTTKPEGSTLAALFGHHAVRREIRLSADEKLYDVGWRVACDLRRPLQ
jgi:hypothetical protein